MAATSYLIHDKLFHLKAGRLGVDPDHFPAQAI